MIKVLTSGVKLEITRSPFVISHRLFKATMKELSKVNIQVGNRSDNLADFFKWEVNDQILNTLKNVVTSILSSEEIEEILWLCFDRVLYNNQKITRDLFDSEIAAGDYLEIAKEVLVLNLSPFTKSLQSLLQGIQQKDISGTQK